MAEYYGIAQLGERLSMQLRAMLFESVIRRDIGRCIYSMLYACMYTLVPEWYVIYMLYNMWCIMLAFFDKPENAVGVLTTRLAEDR